MTWRGGTCCMDNSLSSISPLPRHQGCGQGGPAALATACLPYHRCPDIRNVDRGDLLHGQQLVFHITLAQTSGMWRGGPGAWAIAFLPYHPCPGLHPGEGPPVPLQSDDTTWTITPTSACTATTGAAPAPAPADLD